MRVTQAATLSPELAAQARHIGEKLVRLRIARGVRQVDAALRAGVSRNTAYRMEKGDPGLAFGQILRYLDAIAPGKTLLNLLEETDPSLSVLSSREKRQRTRGLSPFELKELDF
jgi:DNA-binding XRE family transcriptional regulator